MRLPCCSALPDCRTAARSEEHTSELQSHLNIVCRLLLEKKKISDTTAPAAQPLRKYSCLGHTFCRHPGTQNGQVYRAHSVFFNDTATTEIYTLSLHDALPI